MKKSLLGLLVFSSMLIGSLELKADCSQYVDEAKNVTIKTESRMEMVHIPDENNEGYITDYPTVRMNVVISNITENLKVKIYNDSVDKVLEYGYSDTENGVISIPSPDIYSHVNFKAEVYANDQSCPDVINEVRTTTDVSNIYYDKAECEGNEDLEICQPFYDNTDKTKDEFEKVVKEERERVDEENKPFVKKVADSFLKYWMFILIPFLLIIIVFVIRIVILKRGKNNE